MKYNTNRSKNMHAQYETGVLGFHLYLLSVNILVVLEVMTIINEWEEVIAVLG